MKRHELYLTVDNLCYEIYLECSVCRHRDYYEQLGGMPTVNAAAEAAARHLAQFPD